MQVFELVNERTGRVVVNRLGVARAFLTRLRGLLGRAGLPRDEGIFFPDCNSIHMFMMLFAIDVIYVDVDMKVVKVVRGLKPWRMSWCRDAFGAIEVAGGVAEEMDLREGDRLMLRAAGN